MRNERWIRVVAASIAMLLVAGLGQLVVPNQQVMAGDGICCCGETCFEDPGNPYFCSQGCVWYASYMRPDIPDESWGSAKDWDTAARDARFAVDTNPQPGAILVIEGGWHGALSAGHVAYVEDVDEENIYVSEMNWDCDGDGTRECYCERSVERSRISQGGISFIHKKRLKLAADISVPAEVSPGASSFRVEFRVRNDGLGPVKPENWIIWLQSWEDDGGPNPTRDGGNVLGCEHCYDTIPAGGEVTIAVILHPEALNADGAWEVTGLEYQTTYSPPPPWPWGDGYWYNLDWAGHSSPCFNVCWHCSASAEDPVAVSNAGLTGNSICPDYCSGDPTPTPRPTATAGPPTNTPTPAPDRSQCQDETKTGVYLYKDTNYEGSCAFFTEDHSNLGDTPVGDNGASSIRINGEYGVKLYKDTNYGGGYEEIGESEPDLGWRSLGNQFSSIKLQMTQHCDDESLPGVYLYSGKNYEGNCAYFVASHPNLGETAVGGATTSIRINGEYTAWLYEDPNYGGAYDEIGASDPDLSGRSLHGQYASIKLRVTQHCEDESLPGIFLYSSVGYGGDCLHIIENTPHLEWPPGSIRIIGPFWTKIYEFDDYEGRYDVFYVSEADINWYSLGRRRRSAEVFVSRPPTQTPVATATAIPGTATPVATPDRSTATPTPTATATASPTATESPTAIPTSTASPSPSPTLTDTSEPTDTPTRVPTATATVTTTSTRGPPPTNTSTPTAVSTRTPTPTDTVTPSPTRRPTATWTPTDTPIPTVTPTATSKPASTSTRIPTSTATVRPTNTPTETPTATATSTATPSTARIWGIVWEDQDKDERRDEGEPGLAGVKIVLKNTSMVIIRTITTQVEGIFGFYSLEPGSYLVEERDPPGYGSTTFNIQGITVSAGDARWVEFGDYRLPTLTPTVTPTDTPRPTNTPTPTMTSTPTPVMFKLFFPWVGKN